jgi:hypothetical protein
VQELLCKYQVICNWCDEDRTSYNICRMKNACCLHVNSANNQEPLQLFLFLFKLLKKVFNILSNCSRMRLGFTLDQVTMKKL